MKPRMFIASSAERLDLAYAAQENLEHDVEPTVWTQGVFTPSRTTMASLLDVLDETDFGLFIFAPDDVIMLRNVSIQAVRDNVIFELGLFIGRLGSDRCFVLVPRGLDDLHLPTDLVGLAPLSFEPDRQDSNLTAALGPACNRVRKAVLRLGAKEPTSDATFLAADVIREETSLTSDPDDCVSLIESWMGGRSKRENASAIRFDDVDRDLKLVAGSARSLIERAASRWRYRVKRRGLDIIMFEPIPPDYSSLGRR